MKRYAVRLLIPIILCSFSTYATAQDAKSTIASASPESRVRITAPQLSGSRITGRISHVAADTVYIVPRRNNLVAVPLTAITAAEISRGKGRWAGALKGAGLGTLAGGAALGTLVWAGDPNCDYCLPGRNPRAAAAGALIGAVLTAPVGAIVGAVVGSERWETLGQALTLRIAPHPGAALGLGVVLSTR